MGSTAAALAHCHSVVLADPRAAPGITTRPSGADICLSIDHKGLALDQTDCDRKLLFSPQKKANRLREGNRVELRCGTGTGGQAGTGGQRPRRWRQAQSGLLKAASALKGLLKFCIGGVRNCNK